MSKGNEKHIGTDILVIGGGMAGCFAAIKAKERGVDVILADKGYVGKTGTSHFAEGDIMAFRPERGHKVTEWVDLISKRCEYINNREWDEICLREAEDRYKDLVSWGIPFYEEDGKIYINSGSSRGGGGPYENISMLRKKYAPLLRKKCLEIGVTIIDHIMFSDLLKQRETIVGAIGFDVISSDLYIFKTKAIIIATGGSGLKAESGHTHTSTNDGEAMAYRVGAEIVSKEFQFLWPMSNRESVKPHEQGKETTGISGNIVDAMARFPSIPGGVTGWFTPSINAEGNPITGIFWDVHNGRGPLYVDLDAYTERQMKWAEYFFRRMGTDEPEKIGLDVSKRGKVLYPAGKMKTISIPAGSGIWPVNKDCYGGLPGLYSAGNSCGTMASGATYAGMGFGLNHAAVTGTRAGLAAADYAAKSKIISMDKTELDKVKEIVYAPLVRKGGFSPGWVNQVMIGYIRPYFVLGVKHEERLKATLTLVEFLNEHIVPKIIAKDGHEWRMAQETKNMVLYAKMIITASLFRKESRGCHFREDFPRRDDPSWLAWVKLKDEMGEMRVWKEQIPKKMWPDLSISYEERYPNIFPNE